MISELATNRDALIELCERFGVRRLDVFGSAVSGEFDPDCSGVDFLVEIEPPPGMSRFDAYFGLKESLELLLGRRVDLIDPAALENPRVAGFVDGRAWEDYESSAMLRSSIDEALGDT